MNVMLEQIVRLSFLGFTENYFKTDLIKVNREQKNSPVFLCIILQCSVHALCMGGNTTN